MKCLRHLNDQEFKFFLNRCREYLDNQQSIINSAKFISTNICLKIMRDGKQDTLFTVLEDFAYCWKKELDENPLLEVDFVFEISSENLNELNQIRRKSNANDIQILEFDILITNVKSELLRAQRHYLEAKITPFDYSFVIYMLSEFLYPNKKLYEELK